MSRRARAAAVLGWLLLSAAAAWILYAHTRVTTDLTVFLPRHASPVEQVLVDQLRDGVASRLTLVGLSGASPAELARSSKALAARLRQNPLFDYVGNGEDALTPQERSLLWRYRYLLSDAVTPAHFAPPALRQALQARLEELASPIGMMTQDTLPRDPTGDFLHVLTRWSAQQGPEIRRDVWFSRDGRRALLIVDSKAPGFDLDAQQAVLQTLRQDFAATRATPGMTMLLSGPGVFGVEARDKIQAEASRLSLVDMAFLTFLLWLVYRSFRFTGISMIPILSGALFAAVAVRLAFGSIHGITIGFGTTLIGVANDYPIHLFSHMRPGEHIRDTIRRIWPTLRLGVTATMAGFASLLFSSFSGLAQIGLFALVGLLAAGAVTRWVLPSIAPRGFPLPLWTRVNPRALAILDGFRRWRWLPPLALVLAFGYLFSTGKPLWDDDLSHLNTVSERSKALDSELRTELGAPELSKMILIFAPSRELALERSEALARGLDALQARGDIGGYDMAALYLPSQAAQHARQAALPGPATLQRNLQTAEAGLPFKPGLFAPFVHDVARARAQGPLTLGQLHGTPFAMKIDSLLLHRGPDWVALVPLKAVRADAPLQALLAQDRGLQGVYLDLQQESTRMVRNYRHQALALSAWGALAIVVLLALGIRSAGGVLRVLLPMVAAVGVVSALIVLSGRGLTLFHLVSLLLVVGISMDYGLFFNHEVHTPEEKVQTLFSLLVCSATTMVAFGVLVTSDAFILQAIGMTVALGSAFALLFAAMLAREQTFE